jgi:hypothetical protein
MSGLVIFDTPYYLQRIFLSQDKFDLEVTRHQGLLPVFDVNMW